nr:uncharacterized protein LOC127295406 isoform X2 [Lolium perenne]
MDGSKASTGDGVWGSGSCTGGVFSPPLLSPPPAPATSSGRTAAMRRISFSVSRNSRPLVGRKNARPMEPLDNDAASIMMPMRHGIVCSTVRRPHNMKAGHRRRATILPVVAAGNDEHCRQEQGAHLFFPKLLASPLPSPCLCKSTKRVCISAWPTRWILSQDSR